MNLDDEEEAEEEEKEENEYEGIPPPRDSDLPEGEGPAVDVVVPKTVLNPSEEFLFSISDIDQSITLLGPTTRALEHYYASENRVYAKQGGIIKSSGRDAGVKAPRHQKIANVSKRLTGQSEPRCARTLRKAIFPNLGSRPADRVDPAPSNVDSDPIPIESNKPVETDSRPAEGEAAKRSAPAHDSELESLSSSHVSKRRRYSTEPSETFNIVPTDSAASLRMLNSCKSPDFSLLHESVAKLQEDWKRSSAVYESEKASRKETYEAALKRATRRVNDADTKLQEASQKYADDLKVAVEAHAKAIEVKERQLEDKDRKLEGRDREIEEKDRKLEGKDREIKDKERKIESQSEELEGKIKEIETKARALEANDKAVEIERKLSSAVEKIKDLTNQLVAKETQLTLYDSLRTQTTDQLAALVALHCTASQKSTELVSSHVKSAALIDAFGKEDLENYGFRRASEIVGEYARNLVEADGGVQLCLNGVALLWRRAEEAVQALSTQYRGEDTAGRVAVDDTDESGGLAEIIQSSDDGAGQLGNSGGKAPVAQSMSKQPAVSFTVQGVVNPFRSKQLTAAFRGTGGKAPRRDKETGELIWNSKGM